MFAGLVGAVVVAFMWPDTYEIQRGDAHYAAADLRAPGADCSQHADGGAAAADAASILSRGSFGELIQRPALDLYRKERTKLPMEDIINDMKYKGIRIQMVDVSTPGQGRVTRRSPLLRYPDRFKARPWSASWSQFMEENNSGTAQQADTPSGFIAKR